MSLRGRKLIDLLQHHASSPLNSSRFKLPCPPYHTTDFWDRLYKDMSSDDVHEWGGFDLQNGLLEFRYETVLRHSKDDKHQQHYSEEENHGASSVHTSTFAKLMNVSQLSSPEEAIAKYNQQQTDDAESSSNESMLLLGCGSSKVAEQILINSFIGPVLQLDISSKVINLLTKRYERYISAASVQRMQFMVDDAKGLTSLPPESIGGGVFDKGLLDVLHLSSGPVDEYTMDDDNNNPIPQIVQSVHRVLQPSRPFVFFSRSNPEYMFKRAFGTDDLEYDSDEVFEKWKDVEVIRLVDHDMLLYRFVKAEPAVPKKIRYRSKKKGGRRR